MRAAHKQRLAFTFLISFSLSSISPSQAPEPDSISASQAPEPHSISPSKAPEPSASKLSGAQATSPPSSAPAPAIAPGPFSQAPEPSAPEPSPQSQASSQGINATFQAKLQFPVDGGAEWVTPVYLPGEAVILHRVLSAFLSLHPSRT